MKDLIKQLLSGKEVKITYYETAIYLPKSNTVLIDCSLGCCYRTMTLEEFEEELNEH